MNGFLRAFRAEWLKQQRNSFGGAAVFFSLLMWPVLTFCSAYYAMRPFPGGPDSSLARFLPGGNVVLFLITGFAVFQLYWAVVQSAWNFEWERRNGTLEMVFLAPGSRMAFLFGRSAYALFSGIWMFFVFAACVSLFVLLPGEARWMHVLLSLLLTVLSAAVWGAFLCAFCLFSRDSGYLYYIFQAPMQLFGGVNVPPSAFPLWGKGLSFLFPVSYSLYMIRGALNGQTGPVWWWFAAGHVLLDLVLLYGTVRIAAAAETHARRTGSWTLF